jgi:Flp pilus assembly protein protease CpaA
MILILIALVALLYGSYTDIKTREIPDTLSIGLIFLGISIATGTSISIWSYKPILSSLVGFAIGSAVGLLFYYTGQWGGGDAKFLMGLGSLIGIDVFALSNGIPDFGVFLLNLVIFGAVYGLVWIIWLALKNWKIFRPEFRIARREKRMIRIRIIMLSIILLFTVIVIFSNVDFMIMVAIYLLLFFLVVSMYMYMVIKVVEKTCLTKKIEISKLTEGDWIVEKVKLKNAYKYIYTKTGICEQGIKMLKKSKRKTIIVKEGVPFLPSFLLAYLGLLAFGNWISVIYF